ncbi:unnamed protein product [Bursaphelenchus okinawaensis]|uniref:Uncharacterized protein n=1 Tax=Bursaphelenchus okinawaensis TaxID=465554 RepID=A0A811L9A0_9BILA|nr:unnamed protein product [Bursaphelenchus okinawaensis]CAG9119633.1 unnamed protein product [Bursaphelenchus okinawaensis]
MSDKNNNNNEASTKTSRQKFKSLMQRFKHSSDEVDVEPTINQKAKGGGCIVRKSEVYRATRKSTEESMSRSRRRRISGPTLDTQSVRTASISAPPPPPQPTEKTGIEETEKTEKTAADADLTTKSCRTKTSDDENRFDSMAQSMTRTWKKVRTKSQEKFRAVKTFISAPLKEKGMQRMLDRVSRRHNHAEPQKVLKQGDELFPQRHPSHANGETDVDIKTAEQPPPEKFVESPTEKDAKAKIPEAPKSTIFLPDGRPFWQQKNKGDQSSEMSESDLTDDELPMNADIIIKVSEGKVKLDTMPATKLVLKPFGNIDEMKQRDKIFFNRPLVFSNTVRSMVNFIDDVSIDSKSTSSSSRSLRKTKSKPTVEEKKKGAPSKAKITIPNTIYEYDYDRKDIGGWPLPFKPSPDSEKKACS